MPVRHRAIRKDHLKVVASTNECGLPAYVNRSDANRSEALIPQDGNRCRPYRCDDCNLFHIGHLPDMVVRGIVTASEWYGRNGNPPYGEILLSCINLLRTVGATAVRFDRGADQSWAVTATVHRQPATVAGHPDPVAATSALIDSIRPTRTRKADKRRAAKRNPGRPAQFEAVCA